MPQAALLLAQAQSTANISSLTEMARFPGTVNPPPPTLCGNNKNKPFTHQMDDKQTAQGS